MAEHMGRGPKVGTPIPDVRGDIGFAGLDDKHIKSWKDLVADKRCLIVTLPGAFTPTWSTCQVPGLKAAEIDGRLEAAGIDMVYVTCVNDGAVMNAWKKDQGLAGSDLIEFVADTQGELTEALDLSITHPGPHRVLGKTLRCKRSAMLVVSGVVKVLSIAEATDDPAGDDRPQACCIENMLVLCEGK